MINPTILAVSVHIKYFYEDYLIKLIIDLSRYHISESDLKINLDFKTLYSITSALNLYRKSNYNSNHLLKIIWKIEFNIVAIDNSSTFKIILPSIEIEVDSIYWIWV